MFAMTDAADQAVNELATQNGLEETGLRFAVQTEPEIGPHLAMAVTTGPETGDQVLGTSGGAKVFLEEQAAQYLEDKVLDVQQDDNGGLNFAVMTQAAEPAGEPS